MAATPGNVGQAGSHRIPLESLLGVSITRKPQPIHVIVSPPSTELGKQELAQRVSDLFATCILNGVDQLECSLNDKGKLLQAVIDVLEKDL